MECEAARKQRLIFRSMAKPPGKKKKYAVAKSRKAPRKRTSSIWPSVAIGAIVVLGVIGIVVSKAGREEPSGPGPKPGEHWHVAIGYNICGVWQPPLPDTSQARFDLHTHGDALIHMEPQGVAFAFGRATVSNFLDAGGASVTETSIELPGAGKKTNGDKCDDGKPGKVRWEVNGKQRTGDPGKFVGKDGDVLMIGFLPDGQEIGIMPGVLERLAQQTGKHPNIDQPSESTGPTGPTSQSEVTGPTAPPVPAAGPEGSATTSTS